MGGAARGGGGAGGGMTLSDAWAESDDKARMTPEDQEYWSELMEKVDK